MARMGVFLSFDGLDGCGKSTQCRRAAEWLRRRGRDVVECADPGGTRVGQTLRAVLLDPANDICLRAEALLFMASRAQLVNDVVRPALAAGKDVVSDRFLLANVVYQGHAGGLDPALLWTVGTMATSGLEPDLTFVLDLPLALSRARRKPQADRLELRGDDYFARVKAGFLAEAARRPERTLVVDASADADAVHDAIVRRLAPHLDARPT